MSFSNKYNSKLQLFYATDMYNLPMPVTPPADLTIATASFVPAYFFFRNAGVRKAGGFNSRDNGFIRGIGLHSNLADGLVFADTATGRVGGNLKGWNLGLYPQVFDAGVASCAQVAGTDQITGTGFNSFYSVGASVMWIDDNGVARTGTVQAINAGGTAITLTGVSTNTVGTMYTASMASGFLYLLQANLTGQINVPIMTMNFLAEYSFFAWAASQVTEPAGTVSVSVGSTALTGIGTSFVTDYGVGLNIGYTDNAGVRRTSLISSVNSNTSITLVNNALATASNSPIVNVNGFVAYKAVMENDYKAYTISIDPAYGNGTRRLSISAMAEIEYTYPLLIVL